MEEEIKEITEGVNISNSEQRGDSVNMNDRRVNKALFMSSEIMQLDNLNCLLKLPCAYPVTKIKIEPKEREKIAEGFIEKKIKLKPIIIEEEPNKPVKNLKGHLSNAVNCNTEKRRCCSRLL